MHSPHAVVLFSGGHDSTACLASAVDRFPQVETVVFDHVQRHRIEVDGHARLRLRLRLRERGCAAGKQGRTA